MKIVTSFSPSNIKRQQQCVQSWMRCRIGVAAVQSPGEKATFASSFPDVDFFETTNVGDMFGRPKCVRISALAALALAYEEPVIVLNSDIEIVCSPEEFFTTWTVPEGRSMRMGIRWDRHPRIRQARLFKWGIDAFLITPEMLKELSDDGMALGCPGWDYWLPWFMYNCGYNLITESRHQLEHAMHPQRWRRSESQVFYQFMKNTYDVDQKWLVHFIQEQTGRLGVRAWRPRL